MPFTPFCQDQTAQSIPARFEQQVERFPDRLAIGGAQESVSYRDLDRWANRIAHGILARRGPGSEPVALVLEQGAPLVAAILGVLKAGKLYLPLDTGDPGARNAETIADAGAELVVTAPTLDELTRGRPEDSPALPMGPDLPAYLYYTSGSTGRPKGVYDVHRNVLHNIMRYTNQLEIGPDDRLTLLQGPAFSGAVSSLFSALLNGAAVFPYDIRTQGLGRPVCEWLLRERITIYHSVPAIFRTLFGADTRFPAIRIVRLEGDAASAADVALFQKHFGRDCRLAIGLGATETGLTRQYFIAHDSACDDGVVPIGYAVPDMEALILDPAGRELGAGELGEIAIRSRYLAAGYWNQPELTASAFWPDRDGARLYLTGDLGRLRSDGCLEYHGRKDAALKVRGLNVSLAEVEGALLQVDGVHEAIAVTRKDPRGEPRLLAYYVPAGGAEAPSAARFRAALAPRLPSHAIPSRFIALERLPLSANGKVDRSALPEPDWSRAESSSAPVAPRDALEQRLVGVWERVLGVRPSGVADNFFDLGGDSLKVAELLSALEEVAPGVVIYPTTIYEAPTIAELAAVIRGERSPSTAILVPLRNGGTGPPGFCVHTHTGGIGLALALSRHLGDGQPFYGLQAVGLDGERTPLTSIEAMAAGLLEVLRGIQPQGPYHLSGICFGGVVAFEMAQQLTAGGESVASLFLGDVTPEDFPALVPAAVLRRFRRQRVWQRWKTRLARERLPALVNELRVDFWQYRKVRAVARHLRQGHPLSGELRSVDLVNKAAFSRYVPKPYPGRATLVLRSEDAERYRPSPAEVWKRLAEGKSEIHLVPGADGAMWREPGVQRTAELLLAAMAAQRQ